MKNLIFIFFFLIGLPLPVLADHHLVYVSKIVKMSDTSCGVELTITGDNQNGFTTSDAILIGSTTLATLTDVIATDGLNINGTSGHNDTGDTILAGNGTFNSLLTPSFGSVDLFFTATSPCSLFIEGAIVKFINNGSTMIDSTTLASGFGNMKAMVKTSGVGTASLVDLNTTSITVKNNLRIGTTIGTGTGGTSGSGTSTLPSCQLIPEHQ